MPLTYGGLVGAAVLLALAGAWVNTRARFVIAPGRLVDVLLLALLAGLIGARAVHVGLHWAYFQDHPAEILRLQAGGLAWHGAVAGALAGLWAGWRWWLTRTPGAIYPLLGAAAVALPLIGFAGWWGCWHVHCAYGAEVATLADHPGWLVWEARDLTGDIVPRYAVQPVGMAASAVILAGVLLAGRRGWSARRRLGLALLLTAGSLFALGFLRGDPVAAWLGLRADQWLDGLLAAWGALLLLLPAAPAPARTLS
ncbi:MAG: prolipoprotein diacylglyceryl transferase family protein [Chloroflexota bacterium]